MIANTRREAVARTSKRSHGFGLAELFFVVLILGGLIMLLLPVHRGAAGGTARRAQCKNNLKQIGLALHNYHDQYRAFPPAYTVDSDGKPLHSWRTLTLPFMEYKTLYDKIDLTKPWDDPVNAEVFQLNDVEAYRCPSQPGPATHTIYLAVVTSNSCLRPGESARLSDIKDGNSNTLMVIEVDSDHAVPWRAPLDADEALFLGINPTSKLFHTGGTHVLVADGAVRFLRASISAETRLGLISIDGNESLGDF